jgi:hypothetical protein
MQIFMSGAKYFRLDGHQDAARGLICHTHGRVCARQAHSQTWWCKSLLRHWSACNEIVTGQSTMPPLVAKFQALSKCRHKVH